MIEFDKGKKVILRNQDCMEFMKEIPENFVDLIVTDPPYLICTSGAGIYNQPDKQYVKELSKMENGYEDSVLDEMCRVMKKINIYLWCSQKQIIHLLEYFVCKRKCNWKRFNRAMQMCKGKESVLSRRVRTCKILSRTGKNNQILCPFKNR